MVIIAKVFLQTKHKRKIVLCSCIVPWSPLSVVLITNVKSTGCSPRPERIDEHQTRNACVFNMPQHGLTSFHSFLLDIYVQVCHSGFRKYIGVWKIGLMILMEQRLRKALPAIFHGSWDVQVQVWKVHCPQGTTWVSCSHLFRDFCSLVDFFRFFSPFTFGHGHEWVSEKMSSYFQQISVLVFVAVSCKHPHSVLLCNVQ